MTTQLRDRTIRRSWRMPTLVIASLAGVSVAWAEDRPHRFAAVRVAPSNQRVWVPPVYTTQPRVVVIPAVYEERPRQVWQDPVYETRRVLVEEPAEVVRERVPRYDRHGRFIGYATVERVVRPARKVWREDRVLVKAGGYVTVVDRVCVQPERKEVVYERVLLTPGYWTYTRPACDRPAQEVPVFDRPGRYYSRDRRGTDVRGYYRDSDDWGLSIRVKEGR